MKDTLWTELDKERAVFHEYYNPGEHGPHESALVSHPDMPRKRYFQLSARGNWYWRATGKRHSTARAYILK